MRLPIWTAERSLTPAAGAYGITRPATASARTELEPMIKGSCLIGCVGSRAYACLSCGVDAACWESCAGPGAGECVARCA